MLTIEHSVHVKAPPTAVWAHLAALEQAPSWVTLLESVTVEGPIREGTQFQERSRVAGFPFETTWTVIAWHPPHRQAYACATPAMEAHLALQLTPEEGGTRVVHRFTLAMLPGVPAIGRVLELLFGGLVRRALRRSLHRAQAMVEIEAAPARSDTGNEGRQPVRRVVTCEASGR